MEGEDPSKVWELWLALEAREAEDKKDTPEERAGERGDKKKIMKTIWRKKGEKRKTKVSG